MARRKKQSTEAPVREIRRRTRRKFAPEEKIRIVLEGLRGEQSVSELCRREGIAGRKGKHLTRAKAEPKYANPANALETWSGRGHKPKWVEAALKGGKKLLPSTRESGPNTE